LLGAADDKAATIRSATGYAEDCVEKFYQQGALAIASIRHDGSGCIQRMMMFVRKTAERPVQMSKEALDAD
jgi:hypothetical protein